MALLYSAYWLCYTAPEFTPCLRFPLREEGWAGEWRDRPCMFDTL
jgi:hypothetical protein